MNIRKYIIFPGFVLLLLACVACNKHVVDITGAPAALYLVNAIAAEDSTDLQMQFSPNNINYATGRRLSYWGWDGVSSNGSLMFGVPSNITTPLIVSLAKDTTKPVFSQTVNFKAGDIYSLFIGGRLESPGYVFNKDTIIPIADTLTAVRFINMSQDFPEVSINLAGQPDGSAVSLLKYRQLTGFTLYAAKPTNLSYTFEIREAATGDLITSYTYNKPARSKHITLLIRGLKDSYPELQVVRINN